MQLLTRREYNLILRALDKYELYMNQKEKRENWQGIIASYRNKR